jgi:N-acylneuraminate cytidylyltransferase
VKATARPALPDAPVRASAVVLARGGSKRIPRKNAKPFRGRPLLCWPAQAALDWGQFDQVWISTDCPEIEALALDLGLQTLGLRSPQAASDSASTTQALTECVQTLARLGPLPEHLCAIYASAAFLTPSLLSAAAAKLNEGPFDLVFPVIRYSHPIWRALERDGAGQTAFVWPEHALSRTQDLPVAYHDAGQFYFFRTRTLLETGSLMGGRTATLELPETQCHDIDSLIDWEVAELKHERLAARLTQFGDIQT